MPGSSGVELALHHVEEDGDGGIPEVNVRYQGHLQEVAHHGRDELVLVLVNKCFKKQPTKRLKEAAK